MSSNEELAQISKTKRANQQNLSANRDSPISKKSFDLLIDHKNNNTENDSNGSSNEFKETNVDDQCIINTSKNSSRYNKIEDDLIKKKSHSFSAKFNNFIKTNSPFKNKLNESFDSSSNKTSKKKISFQIKTPNGHGLKADKSDELEEKDVEVEFFKSNPLDNFDKISNRTANSNAKSSNSLKFKKLDRTHSGGEISYENKVNDFSEDGADDVDDLSYSNKILSQSLSITNGETSTIKTNTRNTSISSSSLSKSNKICAK